MKSESFSPLKSNTSKILYFYAITEKTFIPSIIYKINDIKVAL